VEDEIAKGSTPVKPHDGVGKERRNRNSLNRQFRWYGIGDGIGDQQVSDR
jgi:hypothetical protein